MRIAIGSDHRGYLMKERITSLLIQMGHQVDDQGTASEESVDYPDFASRVAKKVSSQEVNRGILICGTGIGMSIAANKIPGVRAAPCYDQLSAEISRRHNDLNVLCLSADMLGNRLVEPLLETWINTSFDGGRHTRRVQKIRQLETSNDEIPNDG
mgnify:FL=1